MSETHRFDPDEDDILDILDELGYDPDDPAAKKNSKIRKLMNELFPDEGKKDCNTCKLRCECGANKIGSSKHSSWCPLYKEE